MRRAPDAVVWVRRRSWMLVGVAALLLAYLAVWYRGPYSGDWSDRWVGLDAVTGRSLSWFDRATIPTYPARVLAWKACVFATQLLADHELAARLLGAAVVGLNGLLLGRLLWRLTTSMAAAAVAGLLLTMPVVSPQIVTNADLLNELLGVTFALAFLLAAWQALTAERRRGLWLVAALVDAAAMLNLFEQAFSAILLVPACLLPVAWARGGDRASLLRRAAAVTGGAVVIGLLYYELQYRDSPLLAGRGHVDLGVGGLASRSADIFRAAQRTTVAPDWGLRLLRRSLHLGLAQLTTSWAADVLLAGLVAAVVAAAVIAGRGTGRTDPDRAPPRIAVVASVAGGLVLIPTTLLLPGALLTDFSFDERFLYLPWVGAALLVGGVVAALAGRLRGRLPAPVGVAALGAVLAVGSLCLLGWSRAYADRAARDGSEIAALRDALPSSAIPAGTMLLPLATESEVDNADPVSLTTLGVFEIPWSADGAVLATYRRTDIRVLTMNRWAGITVHDPGVAGRLVVQGADLDTRRVIAFTYRHGGVVVVDQLRIATAAGVDVVVLPLGLRLATGGVPATTVDIDDGVPLRALPPG